MNPELPLNPREELELRLTALLLGELSTDEAAAVRTAIAKDPELTKLHEDLKHTIHLVREAATSASAPTAEQAAQPQLSEERRKKLLTHFAIPPLKPGERTPKPLFHLRLIEILAVLAIIGLLAALLIPNFITARTSSQSNAVINNLRQLEGAKQQWALEHGKSSTDVPTFTDLEPYLKGNEATLSIAGETYTLGKVAEPVIAEVEASRAKKDFSMLPASGVARGASDQRVRLSSDGGSTLVDRNAAPHTPPDQSTRQFEQYLSRAQRALAEGQKSGAVPPPRPPTQIVLPTSGDYESAGATKETPLAAGQDKTSGDWNAGARGRDVEENKRPLASATTTPFGEPEAIGVLRKTAANSVPAPATPGTPLSEDRSQVPNQSRFHLDLSRETKPTDGDATTRLGDAVGVAISPATGLPLDNLSTEAAAATEGKRGEERQVFRERYGLGSRAEESSGRAGAAVATKGARVTPLPPAVAAAAPVGGVAASPAPAASVTLDTASTLQPSPPTALGVPLAVVPAPAGASVNNVPVLGDVPTVGRLYRAVGGAAGGGSGGGRGEAGVTAAGIPTPEPPPALTVQAPLDEIALFAPTDGPHNLGEENFPPAKPAASGFTLLGPKENNFSYQLQEPNLARLRMLERNGSVETDSLGKTATGKLTQSGVTGFDVAGYGGSPAKSVDNFGAITLPTTPEGHEQPADAKKSKLATVPSRSLRLSAVESGGERPTLEKKIASVEKEAQEQRNKYSVAAGKPTGLTQTDVLQAGRIASDMVARELDAETATKSQPYFEKKRELEQLVSFGRILNNKLSAERIDLALPRTTMVEIADKAAPATEKTGFWRSLGAPIGGSFASTARIKVERDVTDIEGMAGNRPSNGYDPFFIQTEFEVIQSEVVLGKVVDALKLDEAWAAENGGTKLKRSEAIGVLKNKLNLRPVRNTSLVEIQAKSDKPDEAAKIANAVAEAYKDQRQQERTKLASGGIAALEGRYQEQQDKVRKAQKELEALRDNLKISDAEANGNGPVPLIEADSLRRITAMKIEGEARLLALQASVNKLKALSKDELRQVLPRNRQDQRLTESLTELSLAEQSLLSLEKTVATNHPTYQSARRQLEKLNHEVDENVAGIMNAIELDVTMAQSQLDALKKSVEDAQRLDIEKAQKSRPYFDKKRELEELKQKLSADKQSAEQLDVPVRRPSTNAPIPQPEIQTSENNFSTFSLNVSDVSFKLAAASLEKGQMPDAASVRSEEFINAFDYRDPEPQWDSASSLSAQTGKMPVPLPGAPIAFAWERARYPFAHNRDLLRFSLKTAAAGRQAGRPLNLVLLLDNSGSMERADRVQIIREALRVLAGQLQPQDKLSIITFARTARLVADGISGDKAGETLEQVSGLTPQGGTNLEEAMNLAYQTALRHYLAGGINRVVLLTDGAANLGNVEPDSLKQKVETQRKQGIALDCFGIGWEGFNDDLLEVLSRNGDGRYGFINSPEEAATEFAGQLAGALKVAASDVKVQVEFNPKRVTTYRQIGYAKHQLTKEQFRDNSVDAAEIAAQEAGNALYTVEVNPAGEGPLCTVRVRYKIPGTTDYREQAWDVPFTGNALSLEQSSPAMRLAGTASAFAERLLASPFAGEVTPDALLGYLRGVPEVCGADARPKKLEWMIRQAKSIEGK